MTEDQSNALTTIPGPEDGGYLILSEPGVIEQVHAMSPTVSDLPKLLVPSGTGAAGFVVPTADGDKFEKQLDIIVARVTPIERQFYATEDGDGAAGPPHCSSPDGKVGVGVRDVDAILEADGDADTLAASASQQLCAECAFSQFGSELDGGKGQACKERVRLLAFVPELVLPMVLHVPPASIKNWKAYGFRLMASMRRVERVVTTVSLRKVSGSPDYFVIEFACKRQLSAEESAKLAEFAEGVSLSYR